MRAFANLLVILPDSPSRPTTGIGKIFRPSHRGLRRSTLPTCSRFKHFALAARSGRIQTPCNLERMEVVPRYRVPYHIRHRVKALALNCFSYKLANICISATFILTAYPPEEWGRFILALAMVPLPMGCTSNYAVAPCCTD